MARNPFLLDAARVRARLSECGATQEQLAEAIGVELRTVQRWLAGRRLSREHMWRLAAWLGVGTLELAADAPGDYEAPFDTLLSPILNWFGDGARGGGLVAFAMRQWRPLVGLLELNEHPARGFVTRIDTRHYTHGFMHLEVAPEDRAPQTIYFGAQCANRLRYRFGSLYLEDDTCDLVEFAHTRAMRGALQNGAQRVLVWIPDEMQSLVLHAASPFVARRLSRGLDIETNVFDRALAENEGAVAFRPAPAALRAANLPPWDDRLRPRAEGAVPRRYEPGV